MKYPHSELRNATSWNSVHVGRAELTLAHVLSSQGNAADARRTAQLAAQQLTKGEGVDHPETRAAFELSGNPAT